MKFLFLFLSTFVFAQQTKYVDFKTVNGYITINPVNKSVNGNVTYKFEVLKPIDTIKIDAQNMTFSEVKLKGNTIPFTTNGKELLLIYPFQKGKNSIEFSYAATPKQTMYFVGSEETDNLEIWTQGQGKYTSHWFPSFDDVNEKVIFNMNIAFDSKYQVLANGILKKKMADKNKIIWSYQMKKPMSSYLLALAIGKFDKNTQKSKSDIQIEMYLNSKNIEKQEPTYRYSKEIFNFLEKEIGVKYPWKIYRQIPVSEFLYAGMENTSSTLFSTRYVVDSIGFEDRSYTNVNAHELAHQWFGDLVTAQSGKDHWLQEGFATYYALLAEKEIYGEDYFYSKLYESSMQLKQASKTDTIPVLNAKASSLSFYQKGAWALHVLRVGIGEEAFRKAVKNYLKKYAYQNVTTQNFFDEIKKVSNYDLDSFSKVWLESSGFNSEIANQLLSKNKSMQIQLEVNKLRSKPLAEKYDFFEKTLQSDVYFTVKASIVGQLMKEKFEDKKQLLRLALQTQNLQVRQAVASTLQKIPEEFRTDYENFLNDKSYQTQELALFYLWNNFENKRAGYMERTKNWVGFNDFNLRILWLSLAISTPEYSANKETYLNELLNYSSPNYEATTRQNALEYLINFDIINETVLKNLVNSTTHHMWQFSKFGRDNIRILLKNKDIRTVFQSILPSLNEKEQFQLNRLLKEDSK
ncbi:M1 family metallopeptidase [Flavobacterium gilvum]|uniref:Aminopeptidase N n=1 Tax=Flavobacterium gilvum TaxID=1492737 RepID=A0AAC9I4D2_9FLAO|nr:M1 family metallopeptidase [Flavobacterium gilvum]AOW10171.1 aminopeptidase [Flavobacterium gilvum]KFC57658.1 aminopeptidase [Flavobacterium gilvum]